MAIATSAIISRTEITLTLTQEEAQYLRTITGSFIGGCGKNRRINDGITLALSLASVELATVNAGPNSTIYLTD